MELDIMKIRQGVDRLAKKYQLDLVVLFGSHAKGKTHEHSDIDIAIHGMRHFSLSELAEIQLDFSQTLELKDVELADLKDAPPLLLKQIAENSILLFGQDLSSYSAFKVYAFKRYMEARPLLNMRQIQFENFLKTHA